MKRDVRPLSINKTYLSRRILAGIIDYLIIFIFFMILSYFFGEPAKDGGTKLSGLPAFSMIMFWFLITVGMEQFFGKTIGNSICGIKPISLCADNQRLSFAQSLKRHLLDMIDMSMFGLIGILLIKNTEKNQRFGDIWAKTTVVKN